MSVVFQQVELSFRTGDMIVIYGDMDEDGFYIGELNGQRGLVPSNFLEPYTGGVAQPMPVGATGLGQLAQAAAGQMQQMPIMPGQQPVCV